MAHRIIETLLQVGIVETPGRSNYEKMLTSFLRSTFGHPDTLSDTGGIGPPEYVTIPPHLDPSATPATPARDSLLISFIHWRFCKLFASCFKTNDFFRLSRRFNNVLRQRATDVSLFELEPAKSDGRVFAQPKIAT